MDGPAIRAYREADAAAVTALCVRAFAPIHAGFEATLGPEIFAVEYGDWRAGYARQIAGAAAAGPALEMHVAEVAGALAGFVQTILRDSGMGEIGLMAVDPAHQRRGVGRALAGFALDRLRARGAVAACVGTGGDAAHGPARALYAAAGFGRAIPSVHLFRRL